MERFLTRPDVKGSKLEEFIDWCIQQLIAMDGKNRFF